MALVTYEYRVIITFDLFDAKSPEYRLLNIYLDEKGFYSMKSIDEHMPSNIYTGRSFAEVEVAGGSPTFNELEAGADKVVRNTFEGIKRNAENAGIVITLFVQASLEKTTSSRKSRF